MNTSGSALRWSRLLGLLLLAAGSAMAQSGISPNSIERVGQSGWQFLKINGDPRQAAMGNAFTAVSRGNANAVFGNPASMADVTGNDLTFNSVLWIADIKHMSAAYARNLGDLGVLGVSFASLDYGDMVETINSPIPGETRTEALVTGRMFSASDIAIGLTYARRITENLSVGGSVRWLREGIAELSMTNWSFDFGTMYYTGLRSLRIAVSARNFGPDSRLVGWSEEYQAEPDKIRMPLDFRIGVAMEVLDDPESPHMLTLAVDGNHPNDGTEKIHLGTEYVFNRMLSIRGGYKINYDEQGLTFGAGFGYQLGEMTVQANYAFVDFGALKQVHMFSIGLGL